MDSLERIQERIILTGRRLYAKGFIAGNSGNISCRLDDRSLVITASGVHKGMLTPEQLLVCNLAGDILGPAGTHLDLTREFLMHRFVYVFRKDVGAVIHAHPSAVLALTLAGRTRFDAFLPETLLALKSVGLAPYATPGTAEVVDAIRPHVQNGCDNVVLDRHGTLHAAPTLEAAFSNLETLEHTAAVMVLAGSMGPVEPLPEAELNRLRKKVGR